MPYRFTIGRRIGTGFGILIFFIILVFLYTGQSVREGIRVFQKSQELNYQITTVYNPSINQLTNLKFYVAESQRLIQNWVNSPSVTENLDKQKVKGIIAKNIPETQDSLMTLSDLWDGEHSEIEINRMMKVNSNLDTLFMFYTDVMEALPDLQSYDDVLAMFTAKDLVATNGKIDIKTKEIVNLIDDLLNRHEKNARNARQEQDISSRSTSDQFDSLLKLVIILGLVLIAGSIFIATFTTRSIVSPVRQLRLVLLDLAKGIFPKATMRERSDEIGEMSVALNDLVDGMKRTTEFSKQVGSGNFDYEYQPLSNEDTLGHALLKMRDDLAENERILEQKVLERTEEVVRQRDEIERQRLKVEELYKDVTDSIRYAKRLQDSILPPDRFILEHLPDSCVLFKPKDIVSGDFYWMDRTGEKVIFAAVDCTGHGVPGAFMSLVGANALNQAVREHQLNSPGPILDDLNKLSSQALNKGKDETSVRDGMDVAMCAIDFSTMKLEYAGANNPLYLIRDGEILKTNPDKFSIGGIETGEARYKNNEIDLKKGDVIYIFSDGYADQFGGPKGKKFMYSKFRKLLLDIRNEPMHKQGRILDQKIEEWRGSYEQIDDILIIGVRV